MPPPPPLPLISLRNATFHTPHRIFPNTTFSLFPGQKLSVLGPSTPLLLSLLTGQHNVSPPDARTYPSLSARHLTPGAAISRISFAPTQAASPGYVSARYESLREDDITLQQYLGEAIEDVLDLGKLGLTPELLKQELMTLSNGQMRRARIAKALGRRPEALLLENPFMGLDPRATNDVSALLEALSGPAIVLGLRKQDAIPSWTREVVYAAEDRVVAQGSAEEVVEKVHRELGVRLHLEGREGEHAEGIVEKVWKGIGALSGPPEPETQPIVEMNNVTVSYSHINPNAKPVLRDFSWKIGKGEKWGLFGPNGSGKTTLTSLITGDHPLSYALDVKHWGRGRLPEQGKPGVPLVELQKRMGVSSPELQATIPPYLTLRRVVRSGFAETPLTPPQTTPEESEFVEKALEEFRDLLPEGVSWEETKFGDVGLETQRLTMFLRAVVTRRELVVLDEAFSGMREECRERCFAWMQGWEGAVVVVSHVSEEVMGGIKKWVRLGERGGVEGAVFGRVE